MPALPEARGRAEARRLVKNIAKEHGHLGEDVLRNMDQDTRREVEEALLKKDLMIGSSVITLAQNLYTSNARFVFELLQNADDNHYSRALASGVAPHVSFHIYHHRIEVECNEDGFTPANLTAICNIGKSSKSGSQGYIGEKGIGFKSVFMAASKAHIQSGDFSFCFHHSKGDSGMGMISPQWQEPEREIDGMSTWITLFLHKDEDPVTIAKQRETILNQFHELQDTILLFLKNIKRINITFYDEADKMASSASYSIDHTDGGNRVALEKINRQDSKLEVCKRYYYVVKHATGHLAKSENRTYTLEEEAVNAYAKSEVILGFPLTEESIPIIEPQELFAFLPIRHMGFTFLIQGDFVTQANRQDIVTTSRRNLGLLDGIADAFMKAVSYFCDNRHPILQYQWMRYLPTQHSYPWGSFWERLILKLKERLQTTPALRPRSEAALGLVNKLRRIKPWALDQEGEPLFQDVEPEAYLSRGYRADDLSVLKDYGLGVMSWHEHVMRIKSDLQSRVSKMQSPRTDDDWHQRAAKLLSIPFDKKLPLCIERLKLMPLLPLQDQRWISANIGPVFYAESEGVQIPRDLKLCLIDPHAAKNACRKALFDKLGVREESTSSVRSLIFEKYNKPNNTGDLSLSNSHCHLQYLYLTHDSESTPPHFQHIKVYCQTELLVSPGKDDIYIANDDLNGAQELLKKIEPSRATGTGAPGLPAHFVHQDYFKDVPSIPSGHTLTWKGWIHSHVNVRRHLRLTSFDLSKKQDVLSEVCQYIADHRPERFLDVLRYNWKVEGESITGNSSNVEKLSRTKVLCKGNRMIALSDTYLPISSLERRSARFMNDTEFFPFLMLGPTTGEEKYLREWEFLHTIFKVGMQQDLDFHLAILASLFDANTSANNLDRRARIYDLYEIIQAQCLESSDRRSQQSKVRDFFKLKGCIFIPPCGSREARWAKPDECLWVAPSLMETSYPLESLYEDYFGRPGTDRMTLTQFFKTTIEVPDAGWRDFVDEIKHLKASSCVDFDRINRLYLYLDEMKSSITSESELCAAFEEDALIYALADGQHGWHKVSECLWASATAIRGKTILKDHYEDLKNFFVGCLKVAELNFAMVREKLIESTEQESVPEIKETLWLFNSLLREQKPSPSPKRILGSYIFPVKHPDGHVVLQTSKTDFAIIDRQSLGDSFMAKAKLLDFNLDEVRRLKPFFRWAGLESRYLSAMVKEISLLQGGNPTTISTRDRDVSRKAYGLFRIAVHYNSPRASQNDSSLYQILRKAHVYETDGISSQLVLSQDDCDLTVEVAKSELHINEDQSGLEIYVPRELKSRDFCYLSKLPPRLLDWMMTEPTTLTRENVEIAAILITTNVINASQSTIDLILEEAGIIEIDIPDSDRNIDDTEDLAVPRLMSVTPQSLTPESRDGSETPTVRTPASSLRHSSSSQAPSSVFDEDLTSTYSRSSFTSSGSPMGTVYAHGSSLSQSTSTPEPSHSVQNIIVNSGVNEDAIYLRLLTRVVTAARRSVFPSRGTYNMFSLLAALPDLEISNPNSEDYSYRLHSTGQERDRKIGAAGELFVFEILSGLIPKLPGFSRANWQSTIRHYTTVHSDYANMSPWRGRETADLVYDDIDGMFTELLIDQRYLKRRQWRGRKPKYYIEVKATTGVCETPFYMSKYQYQRMQNSSNGADGTENPDCVYIVFRVFDLYLRSPGLRIYVDPDLMRQREQLIFTAEGWSIIPE